MTAQQDTPRLLLKRLGACPEARGWVGDRTADAAWDACPRGDWMLWLCAMVQVERPLIARAAALCAQIALVHVPAGENRPRLCIKSTLRWADDPTEANLEAVRAARKSVYFTGYATRAADAAAMAAIDAAGVTNNTLGESVACAAAFAAAYAADAYGYVGAFAERPVARLAPLRRAADIVREIIPLESVLVAVRRCRHHRPGDENEATSSRSRQG